MIFLFVTYNICDDLNINESNFGFSKRKLESQINIQVSYKNITFTFKAIEKLKQLK